MTNSAIRILKDVDVILFVLDGSQEISTGDQFVMERVMEAKRTPRILVINKIDKLSDEKLAEKREEVKAKLGDFDGVVEISGQYAFGLPKLLEAIDPFLEEGIKYYPDDMYTDISVYKIITEIVREKILLKTRDGTVCFWTS